MASRPFKPSRKPIRPTAPVPPPPARLRKVTVLLGGALFGVFSWHGYSLFTTVSALDDVAPPDFDFSHRYNVTARGFDHDVEYTEWFTGITKLRKELVQQARGNVLEAAVGTGRNSEFYDFGRIKSLTLLDQSKEMVEVARAKWQKTHPKDEQCRFLTWSALESLPPAPNACDEHGADGYDTVVATMSLCSVPGPSLFLRNLASHLSYQEMTVLTSPDILQASDSGPASRILLLEHGRSYYSWLNKLLDRTASAHAQRHGCWWNRDIGKIAEDSGLEIITMQRKHFGTTWLIELGLPEEAKGERRQQWLENTRQEMTLMERKVENARQAREERVREQDKARQKEEGLEEWRREQREQMREQDS